MDNRIEKIRAEVDRLHSKWMFVSTTEGYYKCKLCNQLLKFIDSLQEEPVSEDLEEAADNALSNVLNNHEIINVRSCLEMFRSGSKWQKEKDDEEKVLTYKHGFEDCKKQMMTKAIDAHCFGFQGAALFSFRLPADNYLVGSEVKVIVIKEK